ncbi:hypothetical protein DP42_5495 [Burkholderia pseudomallei]|nr:hypothetical protein DP42_5495 [Burkholderia pseudomallei]
MSRHQTIVWFNCALISPPCRMRFGLVSRRDRGNHPRIQE